MYKRQFVPCAGGECKMVIPYAAGVSGAEGDNQAGFPSVGGAAL